MVAPVQDDWIYIQFMATGHVISASPRIATGEEVPLRSQAFVCPLNWSSEQMWRWDNGFIKNKATGMVLDIRKGRLRLIEDTEICLYSMKERKAAQNQLWGEREPNDMFGRPLPGQLIYSMSNTDWVLDVKAGGGKEAKLILCQYIDETSGQCWKMVPVGETARSNRVELSTNTETNHGLTPSNSSNSSQELNETSVPSDYSSTHDLLGSAVSATLNEYKESHQKIYLEQDPHVSDDTIGRAAAYQTWQHWKQEQMLRSRTPASTKPVDHDSICKMLQQLAKHEAASKFNQCDQLISHEDIASLRASQYIAQLYTRIPSSP